MFRMSPPLSQETQVSIPVQLNYLLVSLGLIAVLLPNLPNVVFVMLKYQYKLLERKMRYKCQTWLIDSSSACFFHSHNASESDLKRSSR